jgi:Tol biopolymer transport system component
VGRIVSMKLDGTDVRDFTKPCEGLPYGLSLRHDGYRVAFHLASPQGYQIWTSDINGENRVKIKGEEEHIFFGTSWSPDDQWILYVDCIPESDPGHDWCDVCIGKADGSEHRRLTHGMAMWFAATYGPANAPGGGSNLPAWTADGKILFPRRMPDSKVPWKYQVGMSDLDHFNRGYDPDASRGGVNICRLDPETRRITELTSSHRGTWDFRASESLDGKEVVFCRAEPGGSPAIWVVDADGKNLRQLTRGISGKGVDHPRWLPVRMRTEQVTEKS